VVVTGGDRDRFARVNGSYIDFAELRYHVSTVLSGLYSLAGQPDRAIIEERIVPHPVFEGLTVDGTPDLRIVVYRAVPALAMLRLPTKASRGRANLHQGAVAAGIDLATGRTLGGVCHNRVVAAHPDTGLAVGGLAIPHWKPVLATAAALSKALRMGYIGVDIVLDRAKGPVVLEANARPGLAVQIANRTGLVKVLDDIDAWLSAETLPCFQTAAPSGPIQNVLQDEHRAHEAS
jgi:alpha-L-glutamate ligase-like protein